MPKGNQVGPMIKKARKTANLTQDKLAETVDLTSKYIQYIESGRRNPSLKVLSKIASALKVKIKDLFSD